jgi:hypothetical protein
VLNRDIVCPDSGHSSAFKRSAMRKSFILIALPFLFGQLAELKAISLDAWNACNSMTKANLLGVSYAKGLWVTVGEQGTILTSSDGSNWVQQVSGTTRRLRAITYGNGQFLAVGGDAAPPLASRVVLASNDGTNWSTLHYVTGEVSLSAVAYAKGNYVALASGFSSDILSSTNGSNWIVRATVAGVMSGVIYATNMFVAAGNTIQTSPDGITWTERLTASQSLRGITYGKGKFVAVGDATPSLFVTSNDGTNWLSATPISVGNLKSVSYGNGYYVAVGGGGAVVSSADAITWTNRLSAVSSFLRFSTHGPANFVTVADGGVVLQSGLTAPQLMNAPHSLPGNHQMTVNADVGRVYQLEASTDLVNWVRIFPFTPTAQFTSIAVSTDRFPLRFFRVSTP